MHSKQATTLSYTPEIQPNIYPDIATHDDVQLVTGQLTDLPTLTAALQGCDAIISSLGPAPTWRMEPVITNGYKIIFEAMRATGVKRIIMLGTTSVVSPVDPGGFMTWLVSLFILVTIPGSQADIRALGAMLALTDDIDWTFVRVPFLTSKPGTAVTAGYIGDGKVGWVLRRDAYARFVVDELEKREWVKRMPAISNA